MKNNNNFEIIRSKRKTLALEIDSQANLIIRAPRLMPLFLIKKFIQKKQNWITKKQKLIQTRNLEIKSLPSKRQISKNQAEQILKPRVQHYAAILKLKYQKIKITSAQKRWGSCSVQNNLNFPLRLALAPNEIINYVVVHELCHIKYKNHSQNFWNEVAQIMPDYKKHRKWLKNKGYLLK